MHNKSVVPELSKANLHLQSLGRMLLQNYNIQSKTIQYIQHIPKVFSPVFSPFCHRWSFGSLPLSPLACLVGDTSFPAISST